ncbi:radical SAM protein [Candidatus Pacearchaeota archaeon]|nr:radical SAM protein [Candidatus Pacearchaeota archaeon]MBI2057064.1 radical SAM protein [Candidatus Pacearchaeota archaeon]
MNKEKVMLMYPNFKWTDWKEGTAWSPQPANLCILAKTIEHKYDVSIFDGNLEDTSKEEFYNIIKRENPSILGISVLTNEYGIAGSVGAGIAKKVNPNIKIVMGGVHPTSLPNIVAGDSNIDYAFIGEGEEIFGDFCDFLTGKGNIPSKGLAFKKDGRIINTGRTDFIKDLDKIPFPAYHLVDFMRYATRVEREEVGQATEMPYAHVLTSRGCPYGCCFCEVENISGRRPRLRSVENVISEIERLIGDYGIKTILFDDDNLLINKKRAKDLFQIMINRKYNLKWNAGSLSLFRLDEELIELMEGSGCSFVSCAFESGVQKTLDEIIHKPLQLDHAKKMIKKLKTTSIFLSSAWIIGFPNESWDDIRETIRFAEEMDLDYVKINIATPLPNTELYYQAKEKDYLVDGFRFDRHLWSDGWIKTKEFSPKSLKILRAYEWDRINFTNPDKREKIIKRMNITEERLNEIRKNTIKNAHE